MHVDTSKLNDPDYLYSLRESAKADDNESKNENKLSQEDYISKEQDNTDMFLFVKFINPSLYKKFITEVSQYEV